jgi:hypothetical protein
MDRGLLVELNPQAGALRKTEMGAQCNERKDGRRVHFGASNGNQAYRQRHR